MRLRQQVRVSVTRPDTGREVLLKTAQSTLRSRALRRFIGDQYAVFVLTPVGMHVDAVTIHEKAEDDDPVSRALRTAAGLVRQKRRTAMNETNENERKVDYEQG